MYSPDAYTYKSLSGTVVSATTGSQTLLVADIERKSFCIFNDSPSVLFLKFGATSTTANYSLQVSALGRYDSTVPCYNGIVTGIWPVATGSAMVTTIS